MGYAWIWVGIAVIIATYSLGAGGVGGGIPLGAVVVTIMLAHLGIGIFMLLTAEIVQDFPDKFLATSVGVSWSIPGRGTSGG